MMASKYKNIKTDGYASKKEAKRAAELKLLSKLPPNTPGCVFGLAEQVVYILAPSVVINGRKRPPLRYIADFSYKELQKDGTWRFIIEDVKGRITDAYRIKRHLMAAKGYEIRET